MLTSSECQRHPQAYEADLIHFSNPFFCWDLLVLTPSGQRIHDSECSIIVFCKPRCLWRNPGLIKHCTRCYKGASPGVTASSMGRIANEHTWNDGSPFSNELPSRFVLYLTTMRRKPSVKAVLERPNSLTWDGEACWTVSMLFKRRLFENYKIWGLFQLFDSSTHRLASDSTQRLWNH